MADLIFSAITSLDGFIEDEDGKFDWAAPDEEVHTYVNELMRPIGVYLYGRRMYQTMMAWETALDLPDLPLYIQEFALMWQAANKVVYSKSLRSSSAARTRIERDFNPAAVHQMKLSSARDLTVGGPELAAQAFRAGLVDECQLFLSPVIVGGGKRALPGNMRQKLELMQERRFSGGMVFLRYRTVA